DGGVAKYMRDYYEFPKFCERVHEFIASQRDGERNRERTYNKFASDRCLDRAFRPNMRKPYELLNATKQLERDGYIARSSRFGSRGPAAEGWEIVEQGKRTRSAK